jgi:hypothetical protein
MLGVDMDARWGTAGLHPIKDTLRSRRPCSPASSSRNGFAPVSVRGLWEPSIGTSVGDLCGSAGHTVFVQHHVVGCLGKEVDVNKKEAWASLWHDRRTRTIMVTQRRETAPQIQLTKEGDRSQTRPTPDQTTSISQRHRPRSVVCGSLEAFHVITRTRLTIAGARRRNEAE